MNISTTFPTTDQERWLRQIFLSQSARDGGVVRRKVADVERRVGREALELEVRRRGYHLVECGGQFVIVCSRGALRIVC